MHLRLDTDAGESIATLSEEDANSTQALQPNQGRMRLPLAAGWHWEIYLAKEAGSLSLEEGASMPITSKAKAITTTRTSQSSSAT